MLFRSWSTREGTYATFHDPAIGGALINDIYPLQPGADASGFLYPVAQYDHDEGRAIGAGLTYQGSAIPALVGKYVDLTESYKSLSEALIHAGIHTGAKARIHYIDSENIEKEGTGCLANMDAILVPGGFGKRGVEGKIQAIRFARENNLPYLGICLGMQLAVIEYARSVVGLENAHSTEFDPHTPHPVIALITEWQDRDGRIEQRTEKSDLGGTMRLGGQECVLEAGSEVRKIYGAERISEQIGRAHV